MNKSSGSRGSAIALGCIVVASALLALGCETTVIKAEGISASRTYPKTGEGSGDDAVTNKVLGRRESDRF